jgi:hypothetical protein
MTNQDIYAGDVTELSERVETLTNETGQLKTEFQDRPIIYSAQIRDLGDPHYRLCEPILITLEWYPSEDEVIANYPEVNLFGEGVSEIEAMLNLKLAILDLYDELVQTPKDELGDLPLSWLNILKAVIDREEAL